MSEENQITDEMLKKEMIKKVDKNKIKKLIAMCFNLKDCEILGLDQLLNEWANQKIELYKLLGNELKIEKDINISKETIEQIEKESGNSEVGLKSYWNSEFNALLDRLNEISPIIVNDVDRNFRYDWLKQEMPNITKKSSSSYYNDWLFKKNTVHFSTLMHKMFRSEEVDIEVSKYLQKISANIQGKMYISIDPFDYITMSLNKSGWTSCHSLHQGGNGVDVGCYSAGLFSYMCDDVSVIAFKTDGEKYKYTINGRSIMAESKNWRQMVFIHPTEDYFITSRQYPYESEIITKIIREMVEEKLANIKEVEEDNSADEKSIKWKVSRRLQDNRKLVENWAYEGYSLDYQEEIDENEQFEILHYNDILHGFKYALVYKGVKKELGKIYIGSNPKCVICGKEILTRHNKPLCSSCIDDKQIYI